MEAVQKLTPLVEDKADSGPAPQVGSVSGRAPADETLMFAAQLPFEFSQPRWLWLMLLVLVLIPFFRYSLVDLPRRQMIASTVVRAIILMLLVTALAGPGVLDYTDDVFVVFAVDESLSVGDKGRQIADRFLDDATRDVSPERFRILPFATTPGQWADSNEDETGTGSVVEDSEEWRSGSDLQQVLEVALAGMPPDRVPHVVLLTDGNETRGDVRAIAGASKAPVSVVPLLTRQQPEIQLSSVNVPAEVAVGEPFDVEVLVDANHDDRVQLDVFGGDFRLASRVVDLVAGENRFLFTQQVSQSTQFSALVRPPADSSPDEFQDAFVDNNSASGLVFAASPPRVLLIDSQPDSARHLRRAMAEEKITLQVRPPAGMPTELSELQNFDALILSDVAADKLTTAQMDMIRRYVGDLGGGFIMLGGNDSFGLGGYYRTPVEEVLPVRCDFEKEKEKPGLGMVLIIDKSGSMGGQKLELAKDAAKAAVELLSDKDQIGVIAFDGSPYWISNMVPASQKAAVSDRIAGIRPGGGTTLYPAMSEAFQALTSIQARLKHVIILSDGRSTPGDFDGLVKDMAAAQITVSTVGIGDADQVALEKMASAGNGRHYFTSDATAIPQIFARETVKASKSAINEEPFLPLQVRATRVLDGINLDEAPFLLGYVVTRPKPTSEVILTSETAEPLLSWWRYGLGISVAFTSDAQSRWAAEWLTWDGYNRFWAQVIRHSLRKKSETGFQFEIRRNGARHRISIDALSASGSFLNQMNMTLTLIDPDLRNQEVVVPQTAPGRYSVDVEMKTPGAWQMRVAQSLNGRLISQQSRGVVVGYPSELRLMPTNEELLRQVASTSEGVYSPSPDAVFDAIANRTAAKPTPVWPYCLMAAMLLFVLDVALRRLDLSSVFGSELHRKEFRSPGP